MTHQSSGSIDNDSGDATSLTRSMVAVSMITLSETLFIITKTTKQCTETKLFGILEELEG